MSVCRNFGKSVLVVSTASIALAMPSMAWAQDADETVDETTATEDEGIIVIAQGREQSLSDVPIAVSAVSAESMQNSGANDIRQLNQLAPSLLVSSTGSEANGSARIRGVGTVGDNPGLESSVAVFIDGVYRSRTGAGLNDLGEIERIEVLRGPQGTLFGRNASAGLLNILTKKPRFEFGANVEATYGNFDFMRLSGSITGPLSENIAARLDGVWSQRDGFYKNVDAAGNVVSRINDRDRFFLRGQVLFEASDDVSFRLIGDYTRRNESCCGATYISTLETYDATPGVPGDFAVRRPGEGGSPSGNRIVDVLTSLGGRFPNGGDPYNRLIAVNPERPYGGTTEDLGFSGELNWDLGGAQLTSITAYRDYKAEAVGDIDYTNVDILYRADDGNAYRQFKTFSQELRLQGSAFDDKLDWLVGGYFGNEKLHVRDNIKFGNQYGAYAACRLVVLVSPNPALRSTTAPGCLSAAGRATLTGAFGAAAPVMLSGLDRLSTVNNLGDNNSDYYQRSRNWALFTHNIFNFTDQLSLTLGARYTNENKRFRAAFNNNNTICPTQQAFFSPFLTGGATALPASLQPLAGAIVNLTCQGNSSSALNALNLRDTRKEDEITGTAVLSFKPSEDVLTYASYSKGYKAGGFNLDRSALGQPIFSPTDPRQFGGRNAGFNTANLQFDAEKVDAYELGAKWTGPGINVNVAIFRQDFSDFQLNTFNGSVFLVQNVAGCGTDLGGADRDASAATGACAANDIKPGVRSQGVEVEAAVYPGENVAITMGYTYADTKFRKNLVGRNTGTPLDPALFLLPGDNLSNSAKHVVTGSFGWTPPIGNSGLSGLVYIDARMTSDYNTGSDLFPEKEQDGYATVNARIGVRGPDDSWAVELWAQNLLDQNYTQIGFNTPFQGSNSVAHVRQFGSPSFATANQLFSAFLAEPRTFGLTVRGKF